MKTYLVGGAVRDKLLNYPVIDKDWVVVGASAEKMLELGYTPVGSDFPVFLHPQTKDEYALARTERKSGKGYKGFSFYAAQDVTLEQDLSRRDLTINAMAQDSKGQLTDPFNGQQDLADKVLRHVSSAFSEDPLRVLRVARFNARYAHLGFKVAVETLSLMQDISASAELEHLTKERVWQELEKSLCEQSPLVFFKVLSNAHALDKLFPDLLLLIDQLKHNSSKQNQELNKKITSLPSAAQRLAWLFCIAHKTLSILTRNHAAQKFCEQLRCPNSTKDIIKNTVHAWPILQNWETTCGAEKLSLIGQADLVRSGHKTTAIIAIVQALDFTDKHLEGRSGEKLEKLLLKLRNIDHKALMDQGFKGGELGREIKRMQLEYCEKS